MKKILLASSLGLLAFGPAAHAAGTILSTGPAVTNVTTGGCSLLSTSININMSNGNVGAYDCSAGTASIGVSVASTTGKNVVYSLGSAGGGMTTATGSNPPNSADCGTAAVAKSASS